MGSFYYKLFLNNIPYCTIKFHISEGGFWDILFKKEAIVLLQSSCLDQILSIHRGSFQFFYLLFISRSF